MNKFFRILDKTIAIIMDTIVILIITALILLFTSPWTMPGFWGSKNLGHNIFLFDWDGGRQVIVLSTRHDMEGRASYGGLRLIPNDDACKSGAFQSVEKFNYDKKHIIVKTSAKNTKEQIFFIIYKDFDTPEAITVAEIRDRHMFVTTDSMEFVRHCKATGVNLHF